MDWPTPIEAVDEFYTGNLSAPKALFKDLQITGLGSKRPTGQRKLLWSSLAILSVAALEAGLEELVFSAHGVRANSGSTTKEARKRIVEHTLMTPSPWKIQNVLFDQFGCAPPSTLPDCARFALLAKKESNRGAGKGTKQTGPKTWEELVCLHSALNHIRNATAHGDVKKLSNLPDSAEGTLWLRTKDGAWSVQQPHGLNGLRVVVSMYNVVAHTLEHAVDGFEVHNELRSPDELIKYES